MRLKKFAAAVLTLVMAWCSLGIEPAFAAYKMPYYIDVDLTNQIVTVYNTKSKTVARQMLCSAGLNNKTPTGTWYMPQKERSDERTEWYYMPNQYCWVKYPSKIYYAYFFHSFTFRKNDDNAINQDSVDDFGVPASHGCIRLRIEDAYFIAKNCLAGTRVRIFRSGQKDEELRALLYVSSYSEDEGISYQEFKGISPDALSYGAQGDEVRELQLRLRDLGYYGGDVDGQYATDTLTAVKTLQEDLGLARSGITSPELKEVIFSDEAPVSAGSTTIREGNSGPVVKKLQESLARLGIYQGDIDSVYDADVVDAVKELQRLCGYDTDGVATAEIQHLCSYEVDRLTQALGEDFVGEPLVEELQMGTMNFAKSKIIVRSKANTKSSEVTKLKKGDQVVVEDTQGDWAQVLTSAGRGYMYTKYLDMFTKENIVMQYTGNGETITLGKTLDQLRNGGGTDERAAFKSAYTREKYQAYMDEPVEYATISTGSDDVRLNLRADASGDAEILAEIPNGTKMRVLGKKEGWTRVGYDDQIGYLMNDYLEFSEGAASEVESSANALDDGSLFDREIYAQVVADRQDGYVKVYKEPDTNSKQLGSIRWGRQVKVLSVDEEAGWAQIEYNGYQGYMTDKNLSFLLH